MNGMTSARVVVYVLLCVSWLLVSGVYAQADGMPLQFAFTGAEEVVIPNSNTWGLQFTPDESISYRRKGHEIRMWFAAGGSFGAGATVLLRGPSFEALVPYPLQNGLAVPVLSPSGSGFDSDYAGANSVLPAAHGHDLLMFFHAERHPCKGPFPFLGGIGLARSSDGGLTWQRRGQVISTVAPMPTDCSFQAWGVGNPSVYRSRDGLYLYMLFIEWLRGNPVSRPDVLYLARAPIASDGAPGSWQKYANGQFSQPGLGGLGTPVIGQPPPDGSITVYAGSPSVSFNVPLNRYVVVLHSRLGLHIATSTDGVQWDAPRLIWQQADIFLGLTQNVPWTAYPSLISPHEPTQETTSQSGYLYFARGLPGLSAHFMSRRGFVIFTDLFAAFGARLEINPDSQAFEINSTFTLGSGGTISPLTRPMTIQVGDFAVTIPAGSFHHAGNGKRFVFQGTVKGVALAANLTATHGNTYSLKIEGAGAPNLPKNNPVEVRLGIGSNGGSVTVNAEFQ